MFSLQEPNLVRFLYTSLSIGWAFFARPFFCDVVSFLFVGIDFFEIGSYTTFEVCQDISSHSFIGFAFASKSQTR
jgi:hypothetical protein